jgi:hypothetical protein
MEMGRKLQIVRSPQTWSVAAPLFNPFEAPLLNPFEMAATCCDAIFEFWFGAARQVTSPVTQKKRESIPAIHVKGVTEATYEVSKISPCCAIWNLKQRSSANIAKPVAVVVVPDSGPDEKVMNGLLTKLLPDFDIVYCIKRDIQFVEKHHKDSHANWKHAIVEPLLAHPGALVILYSGSGPTGLAAVEQVFQQHPECAPSAVAAIACPLNTREVQSELTKAAHIGKFVKRIFGPMVQDHGYTAVDDTYPGEGRLVWSKETVARFMQTDRSRQLPHGAEMKPLSREHLDDTLDHFCDPLSEISVQSIKCPIFTFGGNRDATVPDAQARMPGSDPRMHLTLSGDHLDLVENEQLLETIVGHIRENVIHPRPLSGLSPSFA